MKIMLSRVVTGLLSVLAMFLLTVTCTNKKPTQYSDEDEIRSLINTSNEGRTIYRQIWIDTTSRASLYLKISEAAAEIDPLDYWVEVVRHNRWISVRDSCKKDDFNENDTCAEILLDNSVRALAKIAKIDDTIVCRYQIPYLSGLDTSVVSKPVTLVNASYALMAKLEDNDQPYSGWKIYAVGRQRQDFRLSGLPHVDSVVLIRDDDERFVSYPEKSMIIYRKLSQPPALESGHEFTLEIYTRHADFDEGNVFADAYAHYRYSGKLVHEWLGGDDQGVFSYNLIENSGILPAPYSQIVVELFPKGSLRSDNPGDFKAFLCAITYKVE